MFVTGIRQGQQGHGSGVGKAFIGNAPVGFGQGDIGDQPRLAVVAPATGNAQLPEGPGVGAVGHDGEIRPAVPAVDIQGHAAGYGRNTLHPGRGRDANMWAGGELPVQHLTQRPVLNHVAEAGQPVFARVETGDAGMAPVGDMDLIDGGGKGRQVPPQADSLVNLPRALGQCRGTGIEAGLVECRFAGTGKGMGLHHQDIQVWQARRQQQGQAQSGHTATDDGDIGMRGNAVGVCFHGHPAIRASISSIVLGTSAVRTSVPLRVMATSSSIRMPMPRHFSSTWSSSGAT